MGKITLKSNSCSIICLIIALSCCSFSYAAYGQHLKLALGEYACVSNGDCNDGYCDIDEHVCKTCPVCPALPECAVGQHQVDGACVECISNAECTDSSKPKCDIGSFSCQACPAGKPFWNGSECESCPSGTVQSGDSCVCPSDKPHRLATCIACDGNKEFVSEKNACECPADLPNWNTDTEMCVEACPEGQIWDSSANSCFCSSESPYWDSEAEQCITCPGTSLNEKCYICDSSQKETFDKNNLVCSINLNASNFSYGGRGGQTAEVASTGGARPYEYQISVSAYYIDDYLYMAYGPASNVWETNTIIMYWTRNTTTYTSTLKEGYSAYFYVYNRGSNEMGFKGTIYLKRTPRILNRN